MAVAGDLRVIHLPQMIHFILQWEQAHCFGSNFVFMQPEEAAAVTEAEDLNLWHTLFRALYLIF